MANDNNNINELVDNDDDPTVELESPTFAKGKDVELEADAQTFDSKDDSDAVALAGATVSELKSDLKSSKKTIGQLQHDIEQLHAKWLGLETEIGAREAQTDTLNDELSSAQDKLARKEKLIKKRDRNIKSLKSEIRLRNEEFNRLNTHFENLQDKIDEAETVHDEPSLGSDAPQLLRKLVRSERYADTLRQSSQDLIRAKNDNEREISSLTLQLSDSTHANADLTDGLAAAKETIEEIQLRLSSIESKHENEIRILRFELGHAEETVVEAEDLNTQLASDLIDAQGFKDELERMLGDVEESSAEQIKKLEKDLGKLKRKAGDYERKLTTKSEAISVLLAELAKKSEQTDSIDETEDIFQDFDERMSERGTKGGQPDRTTRMLIGTVDDQVLRFPLFKDRLTIGRTKDNDIQLKADYVSRRHAVIQTEGDSTRIVDWGSKNGIHINSAKVGEHFLNHGDVVTIGNARFRYEERKKRDS